ncbi:DUF6055 domain-containing protein [Desulfatitalea alkaliphila]|uniref:DUF6055 domain-containing protein n=1 Tax=Desulfatitalea alkaliphila TaxID=2929485 RepID=A0AA41RAH1_9BACT|nr:DUF6055 domain-containing protein [Desulfatitalea alkaliphila]MCJ8501623.1 DUF6055 domain-containing protein [Desulfatitalea alkaliphila]
MTRQLRKGMFFLLPFLCAALLTFALYGCDSGSNAGGNTDTPSGIGGGCDAGPGDGDSGPTDGGDSTSNIALTANASTSYVSPWETLDAVNSDANPSHSNDKSSGAYGNWYNPDSLQWVQYDWHHNHSISSVEVYWFDDNGGVLTPTTAYLEYFDGADWVRCGDVPRAKDAWNRLALNNIVTNRLRLFMRNATQSTGILEWRVWGVAADGDPTPPPDPNPPQPDAYRPITNQYVLHNVTTANALHKDSDHFRIYYGGNGLNGGRGNLADVPERNVDIALAHLEAAHRFFVDDWGFRSPGISVHANDGPYYKMNIYPTTTLNAGGVMLYDHRAGLSYIEVRGPQLAAPRVTVHEYGHCLTLTEYNWADQTRTGAWWETVANWVADTYLNSPYYEEVRQRFGLSAGGTIIDLNKVIGQSHLTICHNQNYYEAWPFLTYLTNNPDNYPGLGKMAVPDLFRHHRRNNETPLHVLERIASPVRVQTLLGRYWARMAYLDIDHPRAQQAFFSSRNRLNFANLDSVDNQTYRVKSTRQPMYGGANIIPLRVTGNGDIMVVVSNLGNGLQESNFTATVAIRANSGAVRYVELRNGVGQATVAAGEEASLVVVNTPNTLYLYDAFQSRAGSPENIGLDYQVRLAGAVPDH